MEINRSTSAFNWDPTTWASKLAQTSQQAASHTLSAAPNSAQALQEQAQQLQASAVYRQAEDIPDVTYAKFKITINNAKGGDTEVMNRIAKEVNSDIFPAMQGAWKDFRQSLTHIVPDLAGKDFGFTVDKNGSLMVTENSDRLDPSQKEQLSRLMNQSSSLKNSADRYAQKLIEYTAAGGSFDYGRYHLDMENFNKSIDIGLMIDHYKSAENGSFKYTWEGQMAAKGERNPAPTTLEVP
jgi:hypothetical protein